MILTFPGSCFRGGSCYAKMSMGIDIKEPRNLEPKSKLGQIGKRAIDRMKCMEAKENETNNYTHK